MKILYETKQISGKRGKLKTKLQGGNGEIYKTGKEIMKRWREYITKVYREKKCNRDKLGDDATNEYQ